MSFIQLPTLFGSQYLLPGILVVVLLLALLLLFSSRRRAKVERMKLAPIPVPVVDTPDEPNTAEPAPATMSAHAPAPAVVTQPVAVYTQPVGLTTLQPAAATAYAAPQPVQAPVYPQPTPAPAFNPVPPPAAMAAAPAALASVGAPAQAPARPAIVPLQEVAPATAQVAQQPDFLESEAVDGFEELDGKRGRAGRRSRAERKAPKPAPMPAFAAPAAAGAEDPLNTVITELLDGWGDLTPDDMKRLDLFRPEIVSATLASIQLPKSKSNDSKMRLAQLRTYAASLERRDRDNQTVAAAAAAAASAAASVVDATPVPAVGVPPLQTATTIPVASEVTAPMAAPTVPVMSPPPSRSFYDVDPVVPAPAAPVSVEPAPVGVDPGPVGVDPMPVKAQTEVAARHEIPSLEDRHLSGEPVAKTADPGAGWAEPRPLWEPDPEPEYEELLPPAYHEVEVKPVAEDAPLEVAFAASGHTGETHAGNGNGNGHAQQFKPEMTRGIPLDTSALSAALKEPFVSLPVEPVPSAHAAQPAVPTKPAVAAGDSFWSDEPDMSRLSVKVDTAEQLLALPADERVDMTAFLPPTELASTFRTTSDPELKRAVIDTLEHIGTPASLSALGNCFEDPDPDIQIYALAAADRLLGVVQ